MSIGINTFPSYTESEPGLNDVSSVVKLYSTCPVFRLIPAMRVPNAPAANPKSPPVVGAPLEADPNMPATVPTATPVSKSAISPWAPGAVAVGQLMLLTILDAKLLLVPMVVQFINL